MIKFSFAILKLSDVITIFFKNSLSQQKPVLTFHYLLSFNRSLVKELTLGIGNSILDNVDKFVNDNRKIAQNRALQFIFDLRFLVLFFGGNSDTKDQV